MPGECVFTEQLHFPVHVCADHTHVPWDQAPPTLLWQRQGQPAAHSFQK